MSYYSSPRYNTISSSPLNRNHNHSGNNDPSPSSQKIQDQQTSDKYLSCSSFSSSDDDNDKKCSVPYIYNRRHEDYATLQKRREAAVILDNPELLLMYSNARNDSLAGTRYHFTRIFCGFPDEEEAEEEESRKIQKS